MMPAHTGTHHDACPLPTDCYCLPACLPRPPAPACLCLHRQLGADSGAVVQLHPDCFGLIDQPPSPPAAPWPRLSWPGLTLSTAFFAMVLKDSLVSLLDFQAGLRICRGRGACGNSEIFKLMPWPAGCSKFLQRIPEKFREVGRRPM